MKSSLWHCIQRAGLVFYLLNVMYLGFLCFPGVLSSCSRVHSLVFLCRGLQGSCPGVLGPPFLVGG